MKFTIKLLLRIIAAPFLLGFTLIAFNAKAILLMIRFIRYGGEFISHGKKEGLLISEIYEELKKQHTLK